MLEHLKTIGFAVAAAAALWGRPGLASEPEVWQFQCMEDEGNEERICTTEIAASQDGRDFLIYFVHNRDGHAPLVVTGAELPFTELIIKVDDKEPVAADRCEAGMCYFEIEKSERLLDQFRKGRRARVSILDNSLQSILDKDITLRGFTATYGKF